MNYAANTLLKVSMDTEQVLLRILCISEGFVFVIDMGKNNLPYKMLKTDIDLLFSRGCIEIEDKEPFLILYKEDEIPEKYKIMRDKSWSIINGIVNKEPEIFENKYRRLLVKELSNNNDISELSILGYLKRYWKRGKNPNALLPDYYNCGGKGKERASGNVKRGRPRKYKEVVGEGINVTEDIKKIFVKSVNKFYYTTAKNSLMLTYEQMRKEYFNNGSKLINGLEIPIIKPQSEIPSFSQFRYWFLKERNIKREITSRYSNKKFQKQYRAITGNATDGIKQPGIFEIDNQMGDIYLVSSHNRNWVIGRPIIYVVIDKFSKMICGIYIGIETGSYVGAMMSLLNTYKNKVEFCKQFDIEINEEDWPVNYVLPRKLVADRGEIEGTNINNLINTLNIEVSLTPPYRAELKSTVERFHSILNDLIKPHLPRVINLDARERGDLDYRINPAAALNMQEFTKVAIKAVLYYNNKAVLNNYKRDQEMIEDDVLCIPRNIFNWGIANRGGTLKSASEDMVKLSLLPFALGTVTAKGIRYKDMYYTSQNMLKEQIFVNARQKTWKVKINYDSRDLSYIYIHGDKPNEFEKCYLTDASSRYKDKMMEEVDYLLNIEKLQKEKMKDDDAQAKIQLITEIEDIVKQAEKECKNVLDDGTSNKKKIENIKEHRKIEKLINRSNEKFQLGNEEMLIDKKDIEEVIEIESLDLLFKKQMEETNHDR